MRRAVMCLAALTAVGCGGLEHPTQQAGVEVEAIDWSADPCADLYQFTCGNWAYWHQIRGDGAYTSRGSLAQRDQTQALLDIVGADARHEWHADDPLGPKIGDYYGGCSTTSKTPRVTSAPLLQQLARIAQTDRSTLAATIASLHADGVWPFFSFWGVPDPDHPTRPVVQVADAGYGMERSYFLDADRTRFRTAYRAHIDELTAAAALGIGPVNIDGDAVFRIEAALATGALDRSALRDPLATHNPTTLETLEATVPSFDWPAYLAAAMVTPPTVVDVVAPGYLQALEQVLATTPLPDLQSYLRWRVLEAAGNALGSDVDQVEFRFHDQLFYGTSSLSPGWWRCFWATQDDFGFALSQPFVARLFGEAQRTAARAMIEAIRARMGETIASRDWLDAPTRDQALSKLAQVIPKIGYPDQWPSYDDVMTTRTDYLQTRIWRRNAAWRQMLARLDQPVDRAEWHMAPSITNAEYDPLNNDITFPAAILQAPFFALERSAAANYGAIGSVMGHELTHGFDDEGRRYDGGGALRDWWSPAVSEEFQRRTACLVSQYGAYRATADANVDGQLTLGENLADLGGLRLAYAAFHAADGGNGEGAPGFFTPDQQFFISFAQGWCEKDRADFLTTLARTDPHSPTRFRVNGTVANVPEFATAFHCSAGAPLAPVNRCEVW